MHIDRTLWRPHPIVAGHTLAAQITPLVVVVFPFDARKVNPPLVARFGRTVAAGMLCHTRPGDGDFDAPTAVGIVGAVESTVDLYGVLNTLKVPVVIGCAALVIGLG